MLRLPLHCCIIGSYVVISCHAMPFCILFDTTSDCRCHCPGVNHDFGKTSWSLSVYQSRGCRLSDSCRGDYYSSFLEENENSRREIRKSNRHLFLKSSQPFSPTVIFIFLYRTSSTLRCQDGQQILPLVSCIHRSRPRIDN